MKSFGAEMLGADGFAIRGPVADAPAIGSALVKESSGQLGWTAKAVLVTPTVDAGSNSDYLSPTGWKSIPSVTSGAITTALGYTPANDANVIHTTGNETKTGNLTLTGSFSTSANITIAETFGLVMGLTGSQTLVATGSGLHYWSTNGTARYGWYSDRFTLANGSKLGFSGSSISLEDAYIVRNATGPTLQTQAAGGLAVKNLAGLADATISASNGVFTATSGNVIESRASGGGIWSRFYPNGSNGMSLYISGSLTGGTGCGFTQRGDSSTGRGVFTSDIAAGFEFDGVCIGPATTTDTAYQSAGIVVGRSVAGTAFTISHGAYFSDVVPRSVVIRAADAWSSATVNKNGGNVYVYGGAKTGSGTEGVTYIAHNGTSAVGSIVAGPAVFSGTATFNSGAYSDIYNSASLVAGSSGNITFRGPNGFPYWYFGFSSFSGAAIHPGNGNFVVGKDALVGFASTSTISTGTHPASQLDAAFARYAAGGIEVNNGTAGTLRDIKTRAVITSTITRESSGNLYIGDTGGVTSLYGSVFNITAPYGLNIGMGTMGASFPVSISQTWNAAGVTFTANLTNVTDTASLSNSLLHDWQVGGVSKASVNKSGGITATGISSFRPYLQFYSNTPTFAGYIGNGNSLHTTVTNAEADLAIRAAGKFGVSTNNSVTPSFSIDTAGAATFSGLVGLGTSSPVSRLHIVDQATAGNRGLTLSQHTTDAGAALSNFRKSRGTLASPTSVSNGDYVGAFRMQAYDGAFYRFNGSFGYKVIGSVANNSVPGQWYFAASTADDQDPYTNGSVRMVINSNGSVGIGTISPTAMLDVAGAATFSGVLKVSGALSNYVQVSSVDASWSYFDQTASGYLLRSNGTAVLSATTSATAFASGDTRWNRTGAGAFSLQAYYATGTTWQTVISGDNSAGGPKIAFLGATPILRQTLPSAAVDATTTTTLANALRQLAIDFGLAA